MKQSIIHHRRVQVCAALIAADCLVFSLVDPAEASAVWLIIGYILLSFTVYSLFRLFAEVFKSYGERTYLTSKRVMRYATVIIIALIGLQSIGQLTVKDIMAFLPLAVIAYLYFGYGKKVTQDST